MYYSVKLVNRIPLLLITDYKCIIVLNWLIEDPSVTYNWLIEDPSVTYNWLTEDPSVTYN